MAQKSWKQTKKRESRVDSGPFAKVTFVTVAAKDHHGTVRGRPNFVQKLAITLTLGASPKWCHKPIQSVAFMSLAIPSHCYSAQVQVKASRGIGCALTGKMCLQRFAGSCCTVRTRFQILPELRTWWDGRGFPPKKCNPRSCLFAVPVKAAKTPMHQRTLARKQRAGWRWTSGKSSCSEVDASACVFETTNAKVSSGWPCPTLYTSEVQMASFCDALGKPFTYSSLCPPLVSSMFAIVMKQPRSRASRCKLAPRSPSPRRS